MSARVIRQLFFWGKFWLRYRFTVLESGNPCTTMNAPARPSIVSSLSSRFSSLRRYEALSVKAN